MKKTAWMIWLGMVCIEMNIGVADAARIKGVDVSNICFYASFDRNLNAEISKGNSKPFHVNAIKRVEGKYGQAVYLGLKASISFIGNDGNLNPEEGTVDFWFKPDWVGTSERDYHDIWQYGSGMELWFNRDVPGLYFDYQSLNSFHYTYTGKESVETWFTNDQWHRISFSWKKGNYENLTLYVDGERIKDRNFGFFSTQGGFVKTALTPQIANILPTGLMKEMSLGYNKKSATLGTIDEYYIFNRRLSDEEVRNLYPVEKKPETQPVVGNLLWQIGVEDGNCQDLLPVQTQDFASNTVLTTKGQYDQSNYTFIYNIPSSWGIIAKPDFPQAIANHLSSLFSKIMPVNIVIRWQEKETGYRMFRIKTAEYTELWGIRNNLRIEFPDGSVGYLQTPQTGHCPGFEKSTQEPIDWRRPFVVHAGQNEIRLSSVDISALRNEIRFDCLQMFAVSEPESARPVIDIKTDKLGNIFEYPEEISARIIASGLEDGKTYHLEYKIIDYFKRTIESKIINFQAKGNNYVETLSLSTKVLGYLEIVAQLKDNNEQLIKIGTFPDTAKTVSLAYFKPVKNKGKNPDSPFGATLICTEEVRDLNLYEQYAAIAQKTGIKWVRWHAIQQQAIEPRKGEYHWENVDTVLGIHDKYGLSTVGNILYAAPWNADRVQHTGILRQIPKSLEEWGRWVETVVSRYKERVSWWEIWNEPDINYMQAGFWPGTVKEYYEMMKISYAAAKKANPNCKVIDTSVAWASGEDPFLDAMLSYGGDKYFDMFAVHYPCENTWKTQYGVFKKYNIEKPFLNTETMWVVEEGNKSPKEMLAEGLFRGYVTDLAWNTKLSVWFLFQPFFYVSKNNEMVPYGLMNGDMTPTAHLCAYRTLTDQLDGAKLIGVLTSGDTPKSYVFSVHGQPVVVLWNKGEKTENISLRTGSDSIIVVDMMDNETTLTTPSGQVTLAVPSSPIILKGMDKKTLLTQVKSYDRNYKREKIDLVNKVQFHGICPKADTPVELSGDLSHWKKAKPLHINTYVDLSSQQLPRKGKKDLDATFYSLWDEDNLYLAFLVKDDVVNQGTQMDRLWMNDSVQFDIDPENEGIKDHNIGFIFGLMEDQPVLYRHHVLPTFFIRDTMKIGQVKEAKIKISKIPGGLFYETAIPWNTALVPIQLKQGKGFGISVLINDNDGKGRKGYLEWSSGIGGQKATDLFGELICE